MDYYIDGKLCVNIPIGYRGFNNYIYRISGILKNTEPQYYQLGSCKISKIKDSMELLHWRKIRKLVFVKRDHEWHDINNSVIITGITIPAQQHFYEIMTQQIYELRILVNEVLCRYLMMEILENNNFTYYELYHILS